MSATNSTQIDNRSLSIGVLCITACVLFVGLLLTPAQERVAYAEGQSVRSGDFHMTTFRTAENREAIAVTDAAARMVIIYGWDGADRELVLLSRYDLSRFDRADRNRRRR